MFSNKYRLRNTKEIEKVFKFGKYSHGKYILIKYISNQGSSPRIAISVGTKIFRQATKRNRIKRLIRESVKSTLSTLPKLDILIIVKKELTLDTTKQELNKDISNIFKQLTLPKH